jgi:hypothetical protein
MKTEMSNVLTRLADKCDRGYITSEDVVIAMTKYAEKTVRNALLECISWDMCEDAGGCAFVCLEGKAKAKATLKKLRKEDAEYFGRLLR